MNRTTWHVLPHPDGWQLKRRGADRATDVTDTQQQAIDHGRNLADNNRPAQLIIHDRDGQIRDERTYGDDPPEIPG